MSHATDQGDQETTTGWISIQNPILHLTISAVHDRQLPIIPEALALYNVIFEPEEFLAKAGSTARFWAPDQREELQIRYREALSAMPIQPGLDQDRKIKLSQP